MAGLLKQKRTLLLKEGFSRTWFHSHDPQENLLIILLKKKIFYLMYHKDHIDLRKI